MGITRVPKKASVCGNKVTKAGKNATNLHLFYRVLLYGVSFVADDEYREIKKMMI